MKGKVEVLTKNAAVNALEEWLASDDNSEAKLREISELKHAAASAPIYRAADHARARDTAQILVAKLENDNVK